MNGAEILELDRKKIRLRWENLYTVEFEIKLNQQQKVTEAVTWCETNLGTRRDLQPLPQGITGGWTTSAAGENQWAVLQPKPWRVSFLFFDLDTYVAFKLVWCDL